MSQSVTAADPTHPTTTTDAPPPAATLPVVRATPAAGAQAFQWLRTGAEGLAAVVREIDAACESVRLEIYTFTDDAVGRRVRAALLRAAGRGVRVEVLVDALGSYDLPDAFFGLLRDAGADCRWFNPPKRFNFGTRDHRKLFVFDERRAIVGGFNIADAYDGDGVERGWRDLGLEISDPPLAQRLARTFDAFFARAGARLKAFQALRRSRLHKTVLDVAGDLLLGGPGVQPPALKVWLRRNLDVVIHKARAAGAGPRPSVDLATPYFLPTFRLLRTLLRAGRAGCRVRLVLPVKSDVRLSQIAARRLYERLFRAGIEVYEYQPQVLHMKLAIIGDAAFVGSANLDPRSLGLNYELLIRITDPQTVQAGREIFESVLAHSRRVEPATWRRARTRWQRWRERWAFLLLARVDPYLMRLRERWLGWR